MEIYKEDNHYFIRNDRYGAYRILPLSVNQFMNPSQYNSLLKVSKDGIRIKGLSIVYRDGGERFWERNN